jgi:hypothetical protein
VGCTEKESIGNSSSSLEQKERLKASSPAGVTSGIVILSVECL